MRTDPSFFALCSELKPRCARQVNISSSPRRAVPHGEPSSLVELRPSSTCSKLLKGDPEVGSSDGHVFGSTYDGSSSSGDATARRACRRLRQLGKSSGGHELVQVP